MEKNDKEFFIEVMDLVKIAQSSYRSAVKSMKDDGDKLKKMYEDFSSCSDSLANEMVEDVETMHQVLQLVTQLDDRSKASNLLETLRACFNKPNDFLREFMMKAKQRQLKETQQILDDFLSAKKNEMISIRSTFTNYLKDLSGPEKFDAVRGIDIKEEDCSSLPGKIIPGQTYLVMNNDRKWFRATLGRPSGKFQVGDEPVETLYDCFLLDNGHHERISERNIRMLPSYLKELPPLAKDFTLAPTKRSDWRATSTASAKELSIVSPKDVSSCNNGENQSIVLEAPFCRKFKPKYDKDRLQSDPLKHAAVSIITATAPSHIYVRIINDEDSHLFGKMEEELQKEFSSSTTRSATYCPSPAVGHSYATFHNDHWYRVVVETKKDNQASVAFYIDTGVRLAISNNLKFFKLPERFLNLAAQAIRCVLHGVFPPLSKFAGSAGGVKNSSYPREMYHIMRNYNGKPAIAFFKHWKAGEVGCITRFPRPCELTAHVVLYPNEELSDSINVLVTKTSMARLDIAQVQLPEHLEVRKRLMGITGSDVMDASIKSAYGSSSSIQSNHLGAGVKADHTKHCLVNPIKGFNPKFGALELKTRPLKYANVFITKAAHPREIYLRIEDEDVPRYLKMLKDLQEEFRTATRDSESYCPLPILGHVYATKLGSGWCRVVIRLFYGRAVAMNVDTGHYYLYNFSKLTFHTIPNKFLDLPAQAIRCSLFGVIPPTNSDGTRGDKFPETIYTFMDQFNDKKAVAFFCLWRAGQVGRFDKPAPPELGAHVVLYMNDNTDSINLKVGKTSMVSLLPEGKSGIQLPWHSRIRKELLDGKSTELTASRPLSKTDWESSELESTADSFLVSGPSTTLLSYKIIRLSTTDESKTKESTHLDSEDVPLLVSFVGCQSPSELFFRTSEMMQEFLKVHNALYTYFEINGEASASEEPINFDVGFLCAVNLGGRWYRAQVMDLVQYPEVVVFLLDRGVTCNVAASEIRRIPGGLEKIPSTLIHCSLHGVCPLSGGIWKEEVTEFIVQRLKKAEQINIGFRKHQDPKVSSAVLPITVYIIDKKSGTNQDHGSIEINFNEELVSIGLARSSITNVISLRPLRNKMVWKSSELPQIGDTFEARATWINMKGEIFLQDDRWKSELEEIQQYLKEKYGDTLSTEADLRCAPGDLCIVRCRDDSNWYRGTIKLVIRNEVTVNYVDNGITSTIDIKDVRLNISLEDTPVKVLRCSLYNLNSLGRTNQNWNPDNLKVMHKSIVGREFKVDVIATGPPLQVTMFTKF